MPTGYTAKLMEEGQDFNEFVLTCARAMGACVMLRDHDMSITPTEDNVSATSEYYREQIEKDQAKLEELQSMSPGETKAYAEKKIAENVAHRERWRETTIAENARIDAMIAKVTAWQPPTEDHAGLKTFMLEQLTISRHSDPDIDSLPEPDILDPAEYVADEMANLRRRIRDSRQYEAKDKQRNAERRAWIGQLHKSLNG